MSEEVALSKKKGFQGWLEEAYTQFKKWSETEKSEKSQKTFNTLQKYLKSDLIQL
jgi:hypothetical protein